MDINEIKAGKYQLLAVRWDKQTSEPGQPFTFKRYKRGDTIDLDEAEAKRLVAAGAAVTPGSIERAEAERAAKHLQAALNQVPDDVKAELLRQLGGGSGGEPTGVGEEPPAVERPSDKASKSAWVDYAVAKGTPRAEAEKLSRDDLAAMHPAE